ncbi:MAG: hypothetical protein IJR70_02630 [Eubacterium sp.]|nr:hypothetical protein [Eubacterium sp.]
MRKTISVVLCAAAFIYTIWYMHFGTPYKNSGALSTIGIEHKGLFVIWGVLTFSALAFSVTLAYKRYLKTKVYVPLLIVSGIGMAAFLIFDFDYDVRLNYFLHCAGSLIFSITMGTTLFLLFLLCYKKEKVFMIFTYLSAAVLLIDLLMLLIFKENALIESLPIFAGYIMLSIVNLGRDKVEIKR